MDHATGIPITAGDAPEGVAGGPHDRELVERVHRAGAMDAFETLYRRYVGAIHGFALRRSGSAALADDITSATFERALRNIGSFRWRTGGFRAWLYRIAANELADHYRLEARGRTDRAVGAMRLLSDEEAEAVEDRVLTGIDAAELRSALDALNPRYQQVISVRYLAGLSHAEAAAAMEMSGVVMAVTLHRALAALRRVLERRGGV